MFKWRRIFSLRNRALLMVGLPLLSLLSAFAPMFTGNASAVTPEDVLNRARAWSILNAVIDQRQSMNIDIANEDVDNCNIFNGAGNIYVGAAVTGDPDAGDQSWNAIENNSSILNGALASVGIQRGCRGLLETIGYTSNGTGLRQPGDFGNQLSNRLRSALVPNAFLGANLGDGSPGPALSYALLYYNLTQVCGWQYRNSFTDNTDPNNKSRNDEARVNGATGEERNRHYHTYTYEAGKAGDNTYFKSGGREDDVRVGSKTGFASSGNNDAILDCGDNNADTFGAKLADNHRFADAYYALIKPGGDSTPGTCGDRYPIQGAADPARAQAMADACDEGFKNKTNPNYCSKFAGDSGLLGACEYGRGTATGGKDQTTPPPGTGVNNGGTGDKKTCMVEGVGWIVCPIVTFLAKLTDGAYQIVGDMMEFDTAYFNGQNSIYNAWSIMRNFANVAFVIAFLWIVFSQLSGIGLSNYGIKKMLPKLVVIAVLVNISYWLGAAAVDVSNIAGAGVYSLLNSGKDQIALSLPEGGVFSGGNGWANFAGALLAGTAVTAVLFYVTLSVLIPVVVTVLATIITFFLALLSREVLLILWVAGLPIIFVLFLFNGTMSMAKGALSAGGVLLGMYPFAGFVFGGAGLAGMVIMASSDSPVVQMSGAAVGVLAIWIIIPLGATVNKVLGRIGLPGVGVQLKGLKKSADDYHGYRKNVATKRRFGRAQGEGRVGQIAAGIGPDGSRRRRVAQWIAGSGVTGGKNREIKYGEADRAAREAGQSYVAQRINREVDADRAAGGSGSSAYAARLAGPTGDVSKVTANAVALAVKEFNEAVGHEKTTMAKLDADDLLAIMRDMNASEERRAAAAGMIMKTGGDKHVHEALDYLGTQPQSSAISSMQQQMAADMGSRKPTSLSNTAMSDLGKGTYGGTFDEQVLARLTGGKLSAEKLASTSTDELDRMIGVIQNNAASIKASAAANPNDAKAQEAAANLVALENDINAYRTNSLVKQPSNDVGSRMDTIHGLL